MSKAIILCRISDAKQDDGYSLDAQEKYGKEYCQNNNTKIQKIFRFVETGSKSHKRKKFDEMMDFIGDYLSEKKNEVPLKLIVEKPDRLTRNFTNREQLQFFVMTGKLEIHYYKDRRIFDKNCGPADIFTDDMMTSVSKYIALNIAREVNKGMKQKAESGWFPGRAPLGYKNLREGKVNKHGRKEAKIVIDPETVKAARRVFELRAIEKYSYEAIRQTILAEKLLPPNRALKFHKTSVETILNNPFYIGKFEWKGHLYEGKHETFIPKSWFEISKGMRGKPIVTRPDGIFSHYIRCGVGSCGCSVIYDPKTKIIKATNEKKTYHYYHCCDGKRLHREKSIKQVNVSENQLWQQFEPAVEAINLNEELAQDIFQKLTKSEQQSFEAGKGEKKEIERRISDLQEKQDQLYEHFTKNLLDELTYRRQLKKINTEKLKLQRQKENQVQAEKGSVLNSAKDLLELATELKSLWKMMSADEKLVVVKRLCSNPTLVGATLCYDLKKPFKILQKIQKNRDSAVWCARRESNPHAVKH